MDPPEHAKYRDLVNRRFTPRAVRALEAEISEIAKQVMQEIGRTHRFTEIAGGIVRARRNVTLIELD